MDFFPSLLNKKVLTLQGYNYMNASASEDIYVKQPVLNKTRIWLATIFGIGIILMLTVTITARIATICQYSSYESIKRVMEGDTVVLQMLPSENNYYEITLEEVLQSGDSNHAIDSFIVPCKVLRSHYTTLNYQSRNLTLTSSTYEFGEQPANTPIYLLAGSNVTYNFRVWTNMYQIKPPEFVIFDNYESYSQFVAGKNDKSNAVFYQVLTKGPENPEVTEVTFHASKDSYYFITGYAEAGLTYQFNATDSVFFLNETDYVNKYKVCNFSVGVSCSFETSTFLKSSTGEMCLIAYIHKPPSEDPPFTHIIITTKNNYVVMILYPPLLAILSFIIVLCTLLFVCTTTQTRH